MVALIGGVFLDWALKLQLRFLIVAISLYNNSEIWALVEMDGQCVWGNKDLCSSVRFSYMLFSCLMLA